MNVIHGNCLEVMPELGRFDCVFADPPDNIGLGYNGYTDSLPKSGYFFWLDLVISECCRHSDIVWLSFNARWTAEVGAVVLDILTYLEDWDYKPCVQVYTFGQHNSRDFGNNHRPLWRVNRKSAKFYPDAVRVSSWRQRNGDKRANPKGRVPGDVMDFQYPGLGDVLDFPRVTGNSKQRCDWHPTQLHEDLVERIIKFSTPEGGTVLDPFAGTGTTLRVCQKIGREATGIEISQSYCEKMSA